MKRLILLAGLLLAACGGSSPAPAALAGALTRVAAAGDSITLRTGLCAAGESLAQCAANGDADPAASWVTYLPQASSGTWVVTGNFGRGGDTCTAQAPFIGGVFDGQPRGLLARLQQIIDARPALALLLIGINDVGLYAVAPTAVAQCVASARAQLQAAGIAVAILTYPPIVATTPVYGLLDADQRVAALNAALISIGAVDTSAAWPPWAASIFTSDGVHPLAPAAVSLALQVVRSTANQAPPL